MELNYDSLLELESKGSRVDGKFISCDLKILPTTFYERFFSANLNHPDYTYKFCSGMHC